MHVSAFWQLQIAGNHKHAHFTTPSEMIMQIKKRFLQKLNVKQKTFCQRTHSKAKIGFVKNDVDQFLR